MSLLPYSFPRLKAPIVGEILWVHSLPGGVPIQDKLCRSQEKNQHWLCPFEAVPFPFPLCCVYSEWYYTVHVCWNPNQNLLCMKFTYRILGAQLGVQLDSLPAHLWKKVRVWGRFCSVLMTSIRKRPCLLQWWMIENCPPSPWILYCLVLQFLPSCCSWHAAQ